MLRHNSLLLSRSSASCQYLRESEKGKAEEEQAGVREQVRMKNKGGRVQLRNRGMYIKRGKFTISKMRGKGKENEDSMSN